MRSDGLDVPPTKVEPTGSKVGADEHRSRSAACLRPQATGQRGTVGEGALGTAVVLGPWRRCGACEAADRAERLEVFSAALVRHIAVVAQHRDVLPITHALIELRRITAHGWVCTSTAGGAGGRE